MLGLPGSVCPRITHAKPSSPMPCHAGIVIGCAAIGFDCPHPPHAMREGTAVAGPGLRHVLGYGIFTSGVPGSLVGGVARAVGRVFSSTGWWGMLMPGCEVAALRGPKDAPAWGEAW